MLKITTVDLHGVVSELDIDQRIAVALGLIRKEDIKYKPTGAEHEKIVWDAFNDDLRVLSFKEIDTSENPEVHLIIKGFEDIAKNVSQRSADLLLHTLTRQTTPEERIDKYKFSFEFC